MTSIRPSRWLVIAAAIPLGVLLATAGVMSIPPFRGSVDMTAGRDTFRMHCGSCHFATVSFPAHHGPNLHQIGRTGALRKPGQTAAEYILESILDPAASISPNSRPGMPNNVAAKLSPGEIRNVVAFLASRGAFPDYDEINRLEIPDVRNDENVPTRVRLEDMQLATYVLRDKGRCLQCHCLHSQPEYQILAPGLFGVGLTDTKLTHESILDPHKIVSPAFQNVNVLLKSGSVITGRLISRSDDNLTLLTYDAEGHVRRREVPLSEVEEDEGHPTILESRMSLMPTGFDQILTSDEIEAVITLIRQLN